MGINKKNMLTVVTDLFCNVFLGYWLKICVFQKKSPCQPTNYRLLLRWRTACDVSQSEHKEFYDKRYSSYIKQTWSKSYLSIVRWNKTDKQSQRKVTGWGNLSSGSNSLVHLYHFKLIYFTFRAPVRRGVVASSYDFLVPSIGIVPLSFV